MKVALLGGPGSGKTAFAKKLATQMGKGEGNNRPVVIDKYVEGLTERTGYSFGAGATYPQNFQIVFKRWTLEQEVEHKGLDSITCGSLYETIIYAVISSNLLEESQGMDPISGLQDRAAMNFFGMLETMMYNYHAIFYLPYDGKTILDKGASYDIVIDRKIPEVLEGYSKEYIRLDESEKANTQHAFDIVRTIRDSLNEDESSEVEQPAVHGSGDASP